MGYWPAAVTADASKQQSPTDSPEMRAAALLTEDARDITVSPTGRLRHRLDPGGFRARLHELKQTSAQASTGAPVASKDSLQGGERKPPASDPSRSIAVRREWLYDFFDKVVVVTLDRRSDRWERLQRNLSHLQWPFKYPERFRAIDGKVVHPPIWWRAGGGAWGCHQSHLRILEQAMMDGVKSLLVLEDDVCFSEDFAGRVGEFLTLVPPDWDQIYLGGQHLRQRRQPPRQINGQVVRPFNVNRTHAYAVSRKFLLPMYRWLTDYVAHAKHPRHHVDHRLGSLHETGKFNVYAPVRWLAGQGESHSNIKGRTMPTRFWDSPRLQKAPPFVAVIGLHRSGSSCLAGVLDKLGVFMGDRLIGHEKTGGFENRDIAHLCERAFPFPSTSRRLSDQELLRQLTEHIHRSQEHAREKGTIAGVKYPHLCAMAKELHAICGDGLKVIHINRPMEESIASLKTRSRKAVGWLRIDDDKAESVQRWLWERKQEFMGSRHRLDVEYASLLSDPACEIDRIVKFLGITPDADRIEAAIAHVRPELCRHSSSADAKALSSTDSVSIHLE